MRVLTVIDVQPGYMKHRTDMRKCLAPISKLIGRFEFLGWPILLVEMRSMGRTVNKLRSKHPWTTKHGCDGSDQVIEKCNEEDWPLDFVLCGVYQEECVRHTAIGLRKREDVQDVAIVMNATRCMNPSYKAESRNWDEVRLVTSKEFFREIETSVPS